MADEKIVDRITRELGVHKDAFISDVNTQIQKYISSKSAADCLTIVEKTRYGSCTWEPSKALDGYVPRFIAFLRKKKYKGNELDSYLTDKIVFIVEHSYEKFLKQNTTSLVKPIAENLLSRKDIVERIADSAIGVWKATIGDELKRRLIRMLVHRIEDSISTNIVHASSSAVVAATSKTIAAAAAIPISNAVAVMLTKHLIIVLKGVIAKILASTAFKAMFATLIKKMVAAKILAIVISAVGAKIAGISVGWIVAPLIAALIVYEYYTLPQKMAEKISENVCAELGGGFSKLNRNVALGVVNELGTDVLNTFISDVAKDISMRDLLDSLRVECS